MKTVRSDDMVIELDQTKNAHPFIHIERGFLDNDPSKPGYVFIIDSNEGGQIVGEGQGIGMIVLPQKRMRKLRDWLCEQDLGDTF